MKTYDVVDGGGVVVGGKGAVAQQIFKVLGACGESEYSNKDTSP